MWSGRVQKVKGWSVNSERVEWKSEIVEWKSEIVDEWSRKSVKSERVTNDFQK